MSSILVLDPILDLKASAQLKASLLERRGTPLTLDASAVQRLGGLCLQVLLAARRTWTEDGQSMAIGPRSDAFTEALELFRASERFYVTEEA
jgi:chemotaxis protein CheX